MAVTCRLCKPRCRRNGDREPSKLSLLQVTCSMKCQNANHYELAEYMLSGDPLRMHLATQAKLGRMTMIWLATSLAYTQQQCDHHHAA